MLVSANPLNSDETSPLACGALMGAVHGRSWQNENACVGSIHLQVASMQCDPNVVIVFAQMAIPVVLGAVGFYYTRAQVNVARNKLRLDHYDKSFAVFDAARTFLGHAFTISEVTIGQQNEFLAATSSAQFIFDDPKVSKYLDDLLKRVLELPFKREDLHAATNDAERKRPQRNTLKSEGGCVNSIARCRKSFARICC
jgi:hypothetical protein